MLNILSWRNWFKKKKKKAERESHSDTLPPALLPWTDGPIPMGRALSSCQREGPRLPPEGSLGENCPDRPMNLPHLPCRSFYSVLSAVPFSLFLGEKCESFLLWALLGDLVPLWKPPSTWKSPVQCARVSLVDLCLSGSFPHPVLHPRRCGEGSSPTVLLSIALKIPYIVKY